MPPLLTSHRRAGNQSGSNRKLLESSEVVFKECFKRAHIDSISAVGEVLLKDRADSPILRPFRQVYPTGLLDRIKEWLSQVNNRDLVWDSTLNPYRLSTWLVAPPCSCTYTYGGKVWQPGKWSMLLDEAIGYTEDALGLKSYFNSAVINAYLGGDGAVAMHADDEDIFNASVQPATIASLSLGETRDFMVQDQTNLETLSVSVKSGDLLTMDGLFQATHRHGVPRSRTAQGIRYNITFRRIVNHDGHCHFSSTSSSSFSETPVA